ncbi:MAG: helix-turn-helix domain-containing protein [Ferrimicrobium sp.]
MNQDWAHFAGDLLRHSRNQAGLTQRDLAARAGVSVSEVARIETYRVQPSIPVLGRLIDAIGMGITLTSQYIDNRSSVTETAESIKQALAANNEHRAFLTWLVLLDDLNAVAPVRLSELVKDPPTTTGDSDYDALIAGLVEYVCLAKVVDPPAWVDEPWRTTQDWYISGIPGLAELERKESPHCFARRGVYLVEQSLSRA